MGTSATTLLVKLGLGLAALTFVFLLLDEGNGNWALGIALVWVSVGVASLILLTRRRYVRRRRPHREASRAKRLEMRRNGTRQPRPMGGPSQASYLIDQRD